MLRRPCGRDAERVADRGREVPGDGATRHEKFQGKATSGVRERTGQPIELGVFFESIEECLDAELAHHGGGRPIRCRALGAVARVLSFVSHIPPATAAPRLVGFGYLGITFSHFSARLNARKGTVGRRRPEGNCGETALAPQPLCHVHRACGFGSIRIMAARPLAGAARMGTPPFAARGVALAVGATALVLTVLSGLYGYHRDGLYFAMLPPAWGYGDPVSYT